MANVKTYSKNISVPGLPDTTNIQDTQLRLYLDRLNNSFNSIHEAVNALQDSSDIKSIIAALLKNSDFLNFLNKSATEIAQTEAKKEIEKNEKIKSSKNKVLLSITAVPASLTMKPDQGAETLELSYFPDDVLNYQRGVTWSSSNNEVATVDQNGNVTPQAIGECVIEAVSTYNTNIAAYCNVSVAESFNITVYANYGWSSVAGAVVYTEEASPSESDPVWNTNSEIMVTVPVDSTEEEAKQQAASGLVYAIDERDFFVSQTKKVYWRNQDKDLVDDKNNVIDCYQASIAGSKDTDNIRFYLTANDDDSGVKELFSKAYLGDASEATEAEKKEFSKQNCLIAENIKFETFSDKKPLWKIVEYKTRNNIDEEWIDHYSGASVYMVATGQSVTLSYYDSVVLDERVSKTFIEITTYDGRFPCWVGKDIWDGGLGGGVFVGCSTYKPYVEVNEDGEEYIHSGVDNDGDARIKRRNSENMWQVFEYNGILYEAFSAYGIDASIFDFAQFFAWSTPPNTSNNETLFTMSEEYPEQYGTVSNNNFQETGAVLQSGNGVFSITVNSEVFYSTANFGA